MLLTCFRKRKGVQSLAEVPCSVVVQMFPQEVAPIQPPPPSGHKYHMCGNFRKHPYLMNPMKFPSPEHILQGRPAMHVSDGTPANHDQLVGDMNGSVASA